MSFSSQVKLLAKDLLPPIIVRTLRRNRPAPVVIDPHSAVMDAFYGSLVQPNSLCFDIGANIGNRLSTLRRLDMRVVALEPQPKCYALLQSSFGDDHDVTLVNKAAGSAPGNATMMVSDMHVLIHPVPLIHRSDESIRTL